MSVRRAALVLLLLVPLMLTAQQMAPQNDSIRKDDLKADLFFLAHDLTQGRLVGTPGNALAAEFIKSRFERLGLTPAAPDGILLSGVQPGGGRHRRRQQPRDRDSDQISTRLQPGQDYYPLRFSASARVKGPLVFAGFGITAPALSYDDYPGDSVKGKIVLILDHEPGERDMASPFDGVVSAEAAVPFRKVLAAQEKGAIGVLFVADVHNHPGVQNFEAAAQAYWPPSPPRIPQFFLADYIDRIRIPAAQISPALASILIRGTNRTLADLSRSAEVAARPGGPLAIAGPQVALAPSVNRHIVPDRSIVALLEGSDPQLKQEVVIVSAHHDHEGADGNQMFNGADDNASGSVAVIDIAEAYVLAAKAGQRPKPIDSVRRVRLGGARAAARIVGLYRAPAPAARQDRRGPEHGHDRPQHGSADRWRPPFQRPGGAERRVEQQQRQHHRPLSAVPR